MEGGRETERERERKEWRNERLLEVVRKKRRKRNESGKLFKKVSLESEPRRQGPEEKVERCAGLLCCSELTTTPTQPANCYNCFLHALVWRSPLPGQYLLSDGLCFSSLSSYQRSRNKIDKETKTKK